MKSVYQVVLAFLAVLVCVAWTCQAYGLDQDEYRRGGAENALDEEELYRMIESLEHGEC